MDLNRRHRPDPDTTDRLLAGRLGADDAPPGYRRVAALLDAAAGGFSEPAGAAEAETVSAMVAAISGAPASPTSPRRSPMLKKLLAAKTIAAVAFVGLSASGAAAATGNLPDAVQGKVARAAKHIGLDLPGVERKTGNCPTVEGGTSAASSFKNRGQYLKWVRENNPEGLEAAKKSDCGMPVNSKGTPGADEAGEAPEAPEAAEEPKEPKAPKEPKDHGQSGEAPGQSGETPGKPNEAPGQPDEAPGPQDEAPGPPADNPAGVELPEVPAPEVDHPTGDDQPAGDDNPGQNPS